MYSPFTERVLVILRNIPMGKVTTYGAVASLADSPKAARQVVRILHSMSKKHNLPWHRVINSRGQISLKDPECFLEQREMLQKEGIVFREKGDIDLAKFQWRISSYFELEDK